MEERVREFLERNHRAFMATTKSDGLPHVVRVGIGLVDGKLWSSGTQDRVRTKHLHRDPRSVLSVVDDDSSYRWLTIESTVTIHDGPDAVDKNLALYRAVAGEPDDIEEYRRAMVAEKRLIYEFSIDRTYGMF